MTVRYDVLLDPVTGDLPLAPIMSNGIEKVAQSAKIITSLHLGEAIFDTSVGLPYLVWSQQKPLKVSEISDHVKRVILQLEGVVRISQWLEEFDTNTRKMTITGRIVVEDESEFQISVIPSPSNSGAVSAFTITGLPRILGKGII